jgi:hypothetical protein
LWQFWWFWSAHKDHKVYNAERSFDRFANSGGSAWH